MSLIPAIPTAEGTNFAIAPLGEELDWQGKGACRQPGQDPERWFPERPDKAIKSRQVARICNQCEVRLQCAEWALRVHEEYGVWGGMSEEERRKYWRQEELFRATRRRAS